MKLWDNWETRCDIVGVLQEFSRFINRFNLTIRTSVDIKDPVRSVCSQENDLKGERLGLAWVRGSCFLRFYYSLKIDLSVSCFMLCIFHPAACCPHLVTACLCLWNTQSVHGGKTNQKPPQMCDFFVNETKFLSLCMQSVNHGSFHHCAVVSVNKIHSTDESPYPRVGFYFLKGEFHYVHFTPLL